ncbi:MAG: xanthine dehydrogenase family protein molybdopterin-binding subunit [Thermodesulfobacteriota bacterium]
MTELKYVGQPLPKADARDKVTGRAVYINDLKRPGMLYGKIKYSEHAHARIVNIDTSRAKALPGVKAVLTGQDVPEIRLGFMKDNLPLKKGKVRQYRDEVAAVAALDPETAAEAVELIKVEYEPLPAVFDPLEALKEDAPLVHETDPKGAPLTSNKLRLPWKLVCGDVDEGRRQARHAVEDRFQVTWVNHCCMGTSGCIAEFDLDNNLTMYSITQIPYLAQNDYNSALAGLGLKGKNTRVINTVIGGGFGSKLDTHVYEFIAILLAFQTRRPVKFLFSREEEFMAQAPRQPAIIDIAQGCDAEGRLTFREVNMILDNGAYTSWGATTPSVMMVPISSLYRVPNVRYKATCVYTNNIYCQAMRGYGNPQATFAIESMTDMLAEAAGIDQLDFRLLNANRPGEITPQRFKITTCGLKECLEGVAEKIGWREKKKDKDKKKSRGLGLGSLIHVGGGARVYKSDGHGLIMKIDDFGKVTVITGAVEIGQGSETVIAQVTAETVGVRPEDVSIVKGDTAICPWDVGTHASRQAFVSGNAAIAAGHKLKTQILDLAGPQLETDPADLDIQDGLVFSKSDPEKRMPLDKVLRKAHFTSQGKVLAAEHFYDPPNEMLDKEFKGNLSCAYAYGTTGVEVEVDEETGQVEILKYIAAHDVGRALNPLLLKGQIYGAAVMGAGYALTEQMILREGRVMNDNFLDYKILTAMDKVPVEPVVVEPVDEAGPYGAKGVGEPGCVPVAPAIANAVYDAVGVRIKELPITPEKILAALKKKRGEI